MKYHPKTDRNADLTDASPEEVLDMHPAPRRAKASVVRVARKDVYRTREDRVADLQAELRQAMRFGDDEVAALVRAELCVLREDLQRDFDARFDAGRFVAPDDHVAPDVTYTTPR